MIRSSKHKKFMKHTNKKIHLSRAKLQRHKSRIKPTDTRKSKSLFIFQKILETITLNENFLNADGIWNR